MGDFEITFKEEGPISSKVNSIISANTASHQGDSDFLKNQALAGLHTYAQTGVVKPDSQLVKTQASIAGASDSDVSKIFGGGDTTKISPSQAAPSKSTYGPPTSNTNNPTPTTPSTSTNNPPTPTTTPTTSSTSNAIQNKTPFKATITPLGKRGIHEMFENNIFVDKLSNSEPDPKVIKLLEGYFDIYDDYTRKKILNLNEEEQNSVLISLTSKLYNMIVDKIDVVDFGDIPGTKGDIEKLPSYKKLRACIEILEKIFKEYREDTKPVQVIEDALDNLKAYDDIFMQSFMLKISFGMMTYNTIALSVINAVSYMIAVCIEYIKDPKNDGLKIVMDKTGIARVKDYLVYENLINFNNACDKGEIENSIRPLIRARAKNFDVLFGIKAAAVVAGLIISIIPIIRDLVYYFYAARARVAVYLDIQAQLIEMNAAELESSNIKTVGDKESVIRRQLAIAQAFHKLSNKIAVNSITSEKIATKEINNDRNKYKITDVQTSENDNDNGSIF